MCLVVMGVSGSGKTSVGERLAARLGWPFLEGDTLHPASNIAKLHAGIALDDADRAPWLAAIGAWMDARMAVGGSAVIACSALKRRYRDTLRDGRIGVRFAWLRVGRTELRWRLRHRHGHFMGDALLDSQLATLEPPQADEPALVVDAELGISATVDLLQRRLSA
jgi:gluconokinase